MNWVLTIFDAVQRRLSNDDNDDTTGARTTTAQLVNTLYINIFLFVVLVALFELLRGKRSIYLNRYVQRFLETNRVPEPPSLYPLAWIWHVQSIPEHQVLEMIGLDGYMCIRFIVICFRTACFCSFWGLLILVPVYGSTTGSDARYGWDRFTIANIPEDPTVGRLWAPVVMCYLFAGFFCQLMYVEYKNFIGKRVDYLVRGDLDTPVQTYYTVMVERVPASLKSGPMLAGFFERLFPGEFYCAEVAMDLHDLETISAQRKRVRNKLEKAIALCWANHQRPVAWKRPSRFTEFPNPVAQNGVAQLLGYEVVDAIEYYARELAVLNERVAALQRSHFDQRQLVDEAEEQRLLQIKRRLEDHTQTALRVVSSRFADLLRREETAQAGGDAPSEDLGAEEETLTQLKDKRRNSLLNVSRPILGNIATPLGKGLSPRRDSNAPEVTSPAQQRNTDRVLPVTPKAADSSGSAAQSMVRYGGASAMDPTGGETYPDRLSGERADRQSGDRADRHSGERRSSEATLKSAEGAAAGTVGEAPDRRHVMKRYRNESVRAIEGIAKEGAKTAEFAAKGALRGVLEATRALELLTFGAHYKVSSTAFVTFKSRVAKCSCSQMLLSHEYYSMEVVPAPNPNDIVWENVSIPLSQIKIRQGIADGTLIVGALFWSLVVTFISAVSNLESISRVIPALQDYSNTELYQFANNYLAIGLLLILLAILPFIFDFIARSYEGLKTESEIQNSIMTRYFYYQLANVYVSVGLGSVASSLHEILANPSSILGILGASLPSFSIFFANLVIIKTFTAVPIEMLRVFPVLDILSVSLCMDKRKCTRRELRTGAFADPPMLYGWIYPNLMMILMIMLTYCCIAPFMMPLCAFFFALAYLMYKYQLLYVYINSYQSGGFMWYAVFNRSMVALIAGVCTLLCYLAIRMTFISGPFYLLLPLPLMILYFWRHCNKRIRSPATTLSMEGAIELDEEVRAAAKRGENTPHDQFSRTRFRQPTLNEGKLKPAPYRKGKPMLPEDIQGPRPDELFRRQTLGGGDGAPDLEAPPALTPPAPGAIGPGVKSPIHTRTHAPSFIAPLTPPKASVGSSVKTETGAAVDPSALLAREGSMAFTEDDDDGEYDAEDNEKDVDVAVDALLQDENSRKAVNAVSEGVGAIRRTTLIGIQASSGRHSSGELDHEDSAVKLNTFSNKDLESGGGDVEDQAASSWDPGIQLVGLISSGTTLLQAFRGSLPYMSHKCPVTLVTFDVDGTLVRKSGLGGESEPHALAFMHAIGKVYSEHAALLSKYAAPTDIIPNNKYHGSTDGLILLNTVKCALDIHTSESSTKLMDMFGAMYEFFACLPDEAIAAGIEPIPGVIETLQKLAHIRQSDHGVVCGLVTGNVEGIARKKMRACGIHSTGVLNQKSACQTFEGENEHSFLGGFGSDFCSGDIEDPSRPTKDRGEQLVIAYRRALTLLREDQQLVRVVHVGDAPADILAAKWCHEEGKFDPEVVVGCVGVGTGIYSTNLLKELAGDAIPGRWEPEILAAGLADERFIQACGIRL